MHVCECVLRARLSGSDGSRGETAAREAEAQVILEILSLNGLAGDRIGSVEKGHRMECLLKALCFAHQEY